MFKVICSIFIFGESEKECAPHHPPKIRTVFRSGLTIGMGSLWGNSAGRNIRESLLGSAGVGSCPGLSNRCTSGLEKQ